MSIRSNLQYLASHPGILAVALIDEHGSAGSGDLQPIVAATLPLLALSADPILRVEIGPRVAVQAFRLSNGVRVAVAYPKNHTVAKTLRRMVFRAHVRANPLEFSAKSPTPEPVASRAVPPKIDTDLRCVADDTIQAAIGYSSPLPREATRPW